MTSSGKIEITCSDQLSIIAPPDQSPTGTISLSDNAVSYPYATSSSVFALVTLNDFKTNQVNCGISTYYLSSPTVAGISRVSTCTAAANSADCKQM